MKYKGEFSLNGEVHMYYTHAYSLASAKQFLLRRMAIETGNSLGFLFNYFAGNKDNFKITEVKDGD